MDGQVPSYGLPYKIVACEIVMEYIDFGPR
jgi:hypothetical protein